MHNYIYTLSVLVVFAMHFEFKNRLRIPQNNRANTNTFRIAQAHLLDEPMSSGDFVLDYGDTVLRHEDVHLLEGIYY